MAIQDNSVNPLRTGKKDNYRCGKVIMVYHIKCTVRLPSNVNTMHHKFWQAVERVALNKSRKTTSTCLGNNTWLGYLETCMPVIELKTRFLFFSWEFYSSLVSWAWYLKLNKHPYTWIQLLPMVPSTALTAQCWPVNLPTLPRGLTFSLGLWTMPSVSFRMPKTFWVFQFDWLQILTITLDVSNHTQDSGTTHLYFLGNWPFISTQKSCLECQE